MAATLLPPVDAGATVFRLIKNINDHFPPNATKPMPGAFKITASDLADGRKRGIPALFSVFNAGRTSIDRARRLRGQSDGESTPFCWRVDVIRAIKGHDSAPLEVLHDPDPWCNGPGCRGHCGVAGLVRGYDEPKGTEKLVVKAIRSAMIDSSERFDPKRHPSPTPWVEAFDFVASKVAGVFVSPR